jgi:hypothetical protein
VLAEASQCAQKTDIPSSPVSPTVSLSSRSTHCKSTLSQQPSASDAGGMFYPKALQRIFVGLYARQIDLTIGKVLGAWVIVLIVAMVGPRVSFCSVNLLTSVRKL